ncbi:hypothetical protein Q8A67_025608 [Cirrhinus molitorella]|uniref:Insulin-like domain-containing protein n=1 Tax=Cirrhinus molitorella TaxID=172907 RepID=A0AA88T7G9_9TELE|nr:hypothetical protein Q8A67_025608 [Cirrhinus molitorella]
MSICILFLTLSAFEVASDETLCNGELVDAIQFVCGDIRYPTSPRRLPSRAQQKQRSAEISRLVEQCCFNSCSLALLEQFCQKPARSKRDISATSLQVMPALKQEVPRKRDPEIFQIRHVAKKGRPEATEERLRHPADQEVQAERIRAQKPPHHHRPLITLPSKLPPILLPKEDYVSHK